MHAGSQMRPRKVRMRCGIKRGKKHVRVSWGLFQRRSNVRGILDTRSAKSELWLPRPQLLEAATGPFTPEQRAWLRETFGQGPPSNSNQRVTDEAPGTSGTQRQPTEGRTSVSVSNSRSQDADRNSGESTYSCTRTLGSRPRGVPTPHCYISWPGLAGRSRMAGRSYGRRRRVYVRMHIYGRADAALLSWPVAMYMYAYL